MQGVYSITSLKRTDMWATISSKIDWCTTCYYCSTSQPIHWFYYDATYSAEFCKPAMFTLLTKITRKMFLQKWFNKKVNNH